MKATVKLDRARRIIQGWFHHYCSDYGRPEVVLEIAEVYDKVPNAYKVTNPETGRHAPIFWSAVSDYEAQGSAGIPGDLMTVVWDAFSDLF